MGVAVVTECPSRSVATEVAREKEEYQKRMIAKIAAADDAALDCVEITVKMSRREYYDLLEASRFLIQINPWLKGVGLRLEKMAARCRESLDKAKAQPYEPPTQDWLP